jgi:hypothetical protein
MRSLLNKTPSFGLMEHRPDETIVRLAKRKVPIDAHPTPDDFNAGRICERLS